MKEIVDLNRLEFLILDTLHSCACEDKFHGMTITELMEENNGALGARMTVYKKMKKLVSKGYIQKGCIDNHADTFYLVEKSKNIFEGDIER